MPIVDGVIDIPALEWCSILDAVLWIDCGQIPVDPRWENAITGRVPSIALREDGNWVMASVENYPQGLSKLYAMVCAEGGVSMRGRPAVGLRKIGRGSIGEPLVECEQWGDFLLIPRERARVAHRHAFSTAGKFRILTDGMIYPDDLALETSWVYNDVEINFNDLVIRYPRTQGTNIRIGGSVKIIKNAITTEDAVDGDGSSGSSNDITSGEIGRSTIVEKRRRLPMQINGNSPASPLTATKMTYTVDEALEMLSIGRTSIYKLVKDGNLKLTKVGRKSLFLAKDIDDFLVKSGKK